MANKVAVIASDDLVVVICDIKVSVKLVVRNSCRFGIAGGELQTKLPRSGCAKNVLRNSS